MYDIIGDIHGHADKLKKLLEKLGYEKKSGYYKHPERIAIFVGDFIDRGPKIKETLSIVKRMTDEDSALAIMGNHEFNALCYFTKKPDGEYLRDQSEKNKNQMYETIKQFKGHENEWNIYFEWFRTLPVVLDSKDIRIIHACWDDEHVKNLGKIYFSDEFLIELFKNNDSDLFRAIDVSLKGKEDKIPNGYYILDEGNVKRHHNRVKWWLDPSQRTYNEYYFEEVKELTGTPVDINLVTTKKYYSGNEVPVIFGHYWLKDNEPKIQTNNVACVDYSVAKGKFLTAYRWSGERELKNENFVWV